MCKKGLKSHYILTLQSKNKNNAFKAEIDYPITVTLQLVLSYKHTYL